VRLSADDARAEALREFGDLDDAATYCAAVDRQAERRRRWAAAYSKIYDMILHTPCACCVGHRHSPRRPS
jgi:hypothetical protein